MATIQTVPEQPTATDTASQTDSPDSAAESRMSTGGRDGGAGSTQPPPISGSRASQRRASFGLTAAVTIIAALIASMTLAAVTAFNTLRSDIISVRTELREEIRSVETGLRAEMRAEIGSVETGLRAEMSSLETSLRAEMRAEIGSLRTELHDFRTEVGAVLLDHTERLARLEALIQNGA